MSSPSFALAMRPDLVIAGALTLLSVVFGLFLLLYAERVTRYLPRRAARTTELILRGIGIIVLALAARAIYHAVSRR